jgi:NADPH2:quinone reductase
MLDSSLQLRSLVTPGGHLEVSLLAVPTPTPAAGELLVRVEAAPLNPSDLALLLGPVDLSTARVSGTGAATVLRCDVPPVAMRALAGRIGQSLPVGNEGAGTVVAAGPDLLPWVGRRVGMLGGAMYSQYRCLRATDCLALPEGATAAEGASCFVNPLTAQAMVETMRREGHPALVHTAAASNLGQMLNRLCLADGVPLVNVVRGAASARVLGEAGAREVVDSGAPGFMAALIEAVARTGATLGFDAVGGGPLAGQLLTAMEVAASRQAAAYSRYGSSVHKQVYLYGSLDPGPTELTRSFGLAWGLGGWLLTPFLQKVGPAAVQAMKERVARELKTTFASHYAREISLLEVLQPEVAVAYARRATGEKFLVNPSR